MRLLRYGEPGDERPAVLADARTALDVGDYIGDFVPGFFADGGVERLRRLIRSGADLPAVDLTNERLGPPVAGTPVIVCIGLNYADHARESGQPLPAEPVVFLKSGATIIGPDDPIYIPVGSQKTDWEVELAVVIDARARYLPTPGAARRCIAGYVLSNDVSEREFQLERGGQWDKGKSCETFNPIGPWLVTPDEIADIQDVRLWCEVNGERMQDGTTGDMIFPVDYLLWYLSRFMVLHPGDVVNTGTPAGVGLGCDPPRFLVDGSIVRLGSDCLGEQLHLCVDASVGDEVWDARPAG